MLPKAYRKRYRITLLSSLLLHASIAAYLIYNPIDFIEEPESKTVTVKLENEKEEKAKEKSDDQKKKEAEKSKQKEKEDKKKEEEKTTEKKEQKKEKQKKETQEKKEQEKKADKKETEDPLKQEFLVDKPDDKAVNRKTGEQKEKKQKAKEQKAKEQKAKEQKAKEQKAKEQKAKEQKAKEQKAKEQKAKEQKAKEQKAKEQKAKEQKAKEQKAKEQKDKEQQAKKQQPQEAKSGGAKEPGKPNKSNEKPKQGVIEKRFGSMTQLSDQEMQRAVIETKGAGARVKQREIDGRKAINKLNPIEKQVFLQAMNDGARKITQYLNAPKKDGRTYRGQITILLDEKGYISATVFKKRSGNDALDLAFYKAVQDAKFLVLPSDPDARRTMTIFPLTLTYDESDMAD